MIYAIAGTACLLTGLVLACFATVIAGWSAGRRDAVLARIARRAFYATALAVVGAAAALEAALLSHQFAIAYVTEHSDRSLPTALLASTFYSGQEGSLLYWTLTLTAIGSLALAAVPATRSGVQLHSYATAILAALAAFLLAVLVFVATPFALLEIVPADGLGLNPILRDGGMLIHPPFLLAGFASFAVPFAFAMAALLAGRYDAGWIAQTRRLALVAWGLQTTGLTLGMWWAYHVLGWGGYWGWDPVENVALLPWLVTTAYVHSIQVQERRGQLRAWNFGLVIAAFLLSVFGTFLVRSGALVSVHTFAVSDIGPWFFGLLAAVVAFSLSVLALRSGSLRPDRPIQSAISREGAFVLQNFLLAALVTAILWGTLLPLLSGMLGSARVVGTGYYERVAGPLLLALIVLLAAGPLLPWRRAVPRRLRVVAWPVGGAVLTLAALLVAGVRGPGLIAFPAIAAAAATSLPRLARRHPFRNRRHFSAYLAHLGITLVAAGIAGSHLWQQHRTLVLAPGQSAAVASYRLTYTGAGQRDGSPVETYADLTVNGETLEPVRALYPGGQAVSRVVIRSTPVEDLYIVYDGGSPEQATFDVYINPLVPWIWSGAAILLAALMFGNLGAAAPRREPAGRRAPVPVAVPQ
ncbi:MAG TPA: cytochrome c-type biogenesis CcmF C-terminal domain-containing protein [Candidatus Dormibacteraeota bacterium]